MFFQVVESPLLSTVGSQWTFMQIHVFRWETQMSGVPFLKGQSRTRSKRDERLISSCCLEEMLSARKGERMRARAGQALREGQGVMPHLKNSLMHSEWCEAPWGLPRTLRNGPTPGGPGRGAGGKRQAHTHMSCSGTVTKKVTFRGHLTSDAFCVTQHELLLPSPTTFRNRHKHACYRRGN